jgi:hypothetical protein
VAFIGVEAPKVFPAVDVEEEVRVEEGELRGEGDAFRHQAGEELVEGQAAFLEGGLDLSQAAASIEGAKGLRAFAELRHPNLGGRGGRLRGPRGWGDQVADQLRTGSGEVASEDEDMAAESPSPGLEECGVEASQGASSGHLVGNHRHSEPTVARSLRPDDDHLRDDRGERADRPLEKGDPAHLDEGLVPAQAAAPASG